MDVIGIEQLQLQGCIESYKCEVCINAFQWKNCELCKENIFYENVYFNILRSRNVVRMHDYNIKELLKEISWCFYDQKGTVKC